MDWNKQISNNVPASGSAILRYLVFSLPVLLFMASCSITYKFNGATIDYAQTKTISITDFNNQASMVYPPLAQAFTEKLRDMYVKRTKLEVVDRQGDLSISGAITGYDLSPLAVQEDARASRTKFTMTVQVHFEDKANPKHNFDRSFTEFTDFDSGQMFNAVQDQLVEELIDRIVKEVYNATVENW